MYAVCRPSITCPGCGQAREATFRRQGTTLDGQMLLWCKFKCFGGACRLSWVQVFVLLPAPWQATVVEGLVDAPG